VAAWGLQLMLLAGLIAGYAQPAEAREVPVDLPAVSAPMVQTERCSKPAPDTAKGYQRAFANLDDREWGAADVGISVPLNDGRTVWLWGDTFSTGRFVHSTAVVQDGGCLHVSNGGAQLLPNDGAKYYWIEAAFRHGEENLIWIAAEETAKDPKAEWGFRYTGYNRLAVVWIDPTGDAVFQGWQGRIKAPQAAKLSDLVELRNGQIQYSHRLHSHVELASGKTLMSAARNWTDGKMHPLRSYLPVFTEMSG